MQEKCLKHTYRNELTTFFFLNYAFGVIYQIQSNKEFLLNFLTEIL